MQRSDVIRVLVVDDHPLMRLGVRATINAQDDMEVVAEASNGKEAVAAFHRYAPDVILMDMGLPEMNGVEAIQQIRKQQSATKIVALTMYEGDEDIYQALKSGAEGYVLKGMPHQVMLDAIREVHHGDQFLPPAVAQVFSSHDQSRELRPREHEVLSLIAVGKSNKEIACDLGIAERTVKCHLTSIFLRLGVTDRTQAVIVARQRGLTHG